jgi:hypothetical protein
VSETPYLGVFVGTLPELILVVVLHAHMQNQGLKERAQQQSGHVIDIDKPPQHSTLVWY